MSVFSSLTNRIFFTSGALVVVSIFVAAYLVNVAVTDQAERELDRGLDDAARLVGELGRLRFDAFVSEGRFIADLPKIKNAVQTDDPPTVQPIAEEYEQQIRADLFVVTNKSGRILAQTGRVAPDLSTLEAMLQPSLGAREGSWFWPYADGVLQVAAIPLVIEPGPAILGSLVVGFSLDQAAAQQLKAGTDSDIAVVAGSRIVASTLDTERTNALLPLVGQRRSFQARLGRDEYVARVQPFGGGIDDRDRPVAFVLRSRTERLRFLDSLHLQIAVTGIAAVLLATLVGYAVARSVTRPLRAVTQTMREMAATGDLTRTPPPIGRLDDEDARLLATTFRKLTSALDRFQHEVRQRERLSSLGRLSTVIAHEIRNPLMIIKAAARTLRGNTSREVADAASSIDEEVKRLDRVVSEVLDFGRPIRFDLSPADLVEICRNAAHAVEAAPEGVPVALEPAEPHAPIVTDAERLRAVLVNVLTNAQHAVRAAGRNGAEPAIRMRTERGAGRWRIEVADTGAGIAAQDLPRLFEPFFTTSRTGSGLGLAIARNIVEGLGGTIGIESQVNVGTTVRIDLPERASRPEAHA